MAQRRVRSGEVVSLAPLGPRLAGARTGALLKASELEVIRLVMQAGDQLPEHSAPGEMTLLGIEGRLELTVPGGRIELGPADFVHLAAGVPHAVRCIASASALLTLALPTATRTQRPAASVTPENNKAHDH